MFDHDAKGNWEMCTYGLQEKFIILTEPMKVGGVSLEVLTIRLAVGTEKECEMQRGLFY